MKYGLKEILRRMIVKYTGYQISPLNMLVIEPTNHCTCSCPICGAAQESGQNVQKGFMEWETFLFIAEEAASIKPRQVCIYNRGESLLYDRIFEMIHVLSKNGLFTELVTNGELMTPDISLSLLQSGLNKLVISYPGITQENYYKCRNKILNIQMEENIKKSISVWKNSGRTVSIRSLLIHNSKTVKKNRTQSLVHKELPKFMRNWLSSDGLSMLEIHGYMPWPGHFDKELLSHLTANRKRCDLTLDSLTVFWNGVTTPCSYDIEGVLSAGEFPKSGLRDIYNNRAMRSFRRQIYKNSNIPSLCRNCLIPKYPVPLKVYYPENADEQIKEVERMIFKLKA